MALAGCVSQVVNQIPDLMSRLSCSGHPVQVTCACVFHLCGVCACVLVHSRPRWWVQRLPDCYWLHLCCNRPRDGAPNPIFAGSEPHIPPTQANRRAGRFHPDLTRKQHTMLLAVKQCLVWNRSFQGCRNVYSMCCCNSVQIWKHANVNSRATQCFELHQCQSKVAEQDSL